MRLVSPRFKQRITLLIKNPTSATTIIGTTTVTALPRLINERQNAIYNAETTGHSADPFEDHIYNAPLVPEPTPGALPGKRLAPPPLELISAPEFMLYLTPVAAPENVMPPGITAPDWSERRTLRKSRGAGSALQSPAKLCPPGYVE